MATPDEQPDRFELQRFIAAQAGVYTQALAEIRAGRKQSHWMWFIFPQIDGLGSSPTARRYAIKSRAEAEAYLQHPVLGARLVECAEAALAVDGRSALQIFSQPDDMKLRSSATLFAAVDSRGTVFQRVIDKYFDGEPDRRTQELLGAGAE